MSPVKMNPLGSPDHKQRASQIMTPTRAASGPVATKETLSERVLAFIQQGSSKQWGHSKSDIRQNFREIAEDAISEALEVLKDDGLVYETMDDSHFKAS